MTNTEIPLNKITDTTELFRQFPAAMQADLQALKCPESVRNWFSERIQILRKVSNAFDRRLSHMRETADRRFRIAHDYYAFPQQTSRIGGKLKAVQTAEYDEDEYASERAFRDDQQHQAAELEAQLRKTKTGFALTSAEFKTCQRLEENFKTAADDYRSRIERLAAGLVWLIHTNQSNSEIVEEIRRCQLRGFADLTGAIMRHELSVESDFRDLDLNRPSYQNSDLDVPCYDLGSIIPFEY